MPDTGSDVTSWSHRESAGHNTDTRGLHSNGGREEGSWARRADSLEGRTRLPASPHPFLLVLPVARVAGGCGTARRAPKVLLVDAVPQRVGDAADDGSPGRQFNRVNKKERSFKTFGDNAS